VSCTPRSKGFLHIGVRKKRGTQISQDWSVHAARHVRAPRHFLRGNMNLEAMPIGVGNGRAEYDAVESGPQRVGHAHRARLASGVHRVSGQGRTLQLLAGQANGARFGVGTWIALAHDRIGPTHQPLAAARVYNQCAERYRVGCFEGACGEPKNFAHACFIHRRQTFGHLYSGSHAAIYHMVWGHAASLALYFYMERIRRLDEKPGVLFFRTDAGSPWALPDFELPNW